MTTRRASRDERSQILSDLHSYSINLKTRDVYIHSVHEEEEMGVDFRQANIFIKNLHILNSISEEPILIHMHSIGGSWYDGMAMFNAIEFSKAPVTILSYAQASSMTGILLQSAPTRVMMPDCHFMMHHGSTDVYGELHPMAAEQAFLLEKEACKRMLEVFAKRAVKGKFFREKKWTTVDSAYKFIEKTLKDKVDWYLDAEEAVYYGLADAVLGGRKFKTMESLKGTK